MKLKLPGAVLAALILVPPAVLVWTWQLERWRAEAAAARHVADGERALAAGNALRAVAAFDKAREIRPGDPELQRASWRARALLAAQRPERITEENQEELRYEAERLLEEGLDKATALTALAQLLRKAGDGQGADRRLAEALAADPRSVVAHLARAAELAKSGAAPAEVGLAYAKVVELAPENFAAHYALGRVAMLQKDTAREIAELKKATSLQDHAGAWEALGDAHLHAQDTKEALLAYHRAARLAPARAEPHLGMGLIHAREGRWREAEKELKQASQAGARFSDLGFQLAVALARQGRCSEAVPLLAQLVRESPGHGPALYEMASCAAALGQKETAVGFYRQLAALALPPEGDPARGPAEERARAAQAALAQLVPAAPPAPAPAPVPQAKPVK